jgi:hypothetical protein
MLRERFGFDFDLLIFIVVSGCFRMYPSDMHQISIILSWFLSTVSMRITSLPRCLTHFTGSTVNVDIFSLAGVATEVEDLRMLSRSPAAPADGSETRSIW